MSQADTKSSQGKSRRRPSSGLSDGVNDEHMIDLTSIHMRDASNFPIDLDIPAEFQNMLAADILKSSEHIHVYDTICEKLFEERTVKFTALLFWLVFCLKFQPQSESIIDALRKRLSKVYTKIFSRLPRGKEELSNYLVLLVGYCIQMSFYDVFPLNRAKFDMRFILDIYHVVLYEVHGAYVSDYYIQSTIERMFGSKFFFYENKYQRKKKVEVKSQKDEPLLRNLHFNGESLLHVHGGVEFASELSSKLREKGREYGSIPTWESEPTQQSFDQSKLSSTQKKPDQKARDKTTDISKPTEGSNPTDKAPNRSTNRKTYLPKLKFDCTQLSPTVARFLNNPTNSLPFRRKKLVLHTNNKHLAEFQEYDVSSSLEALITTKAKKKVQKAPHETKFQHYKLKNRPDNYALDYLPQRLRDKFREEIDLKYILDNTGNYYMHPNTTRNDEITSNYGSTSKRSYVTQPESQSTGMFTDRVLNTDRLPIIHELRTAPINPKSDEHPYSHDDGQFKKRESWRGDPLDKSLVNKSTLHTESDHHLSPTKDGDDQSVSSATAHSTSLKKLNKANRKIHLINTFKNHSPHPTSHNDEEEEEVEKKKSFTQPKMTLQYQELSKNARQRQDLEEDNQLSSNKKDSKTYMYEDSRLKYKDAHGPLVKESIDQNINELVSKLVVKRNVFSKNVGKVAVLPHGSKLKK